MREQLLKQWTDALLRYQVRNTGDPRLDGGILCPACMRIHGRSGDAILPLCTMYQETGDPQYLDSAQRLFAWSENMVRPDGSYNNDTNSNWNGITVFSAIAQGEVLLHDRGSLPEDFTAAIRKRFTVSANYLLQHIEEIGGNINYPVTCAYAMALAAKLIPQQRDAFATKGRSLAAFAAEHFSSDGLLWGEGHPMTAVTPHDCRPVDIGYNVEESLPSLIQYADLTGDHALMEQVHHIARVHLDFLLPDGGWDNSFGSRSYKWSYWGSRTSDGCLAGFAILAREDPLFASAVRRNLTQLQQCTHNGLLYGGPMYDSAGEPPCIHHTICHAKALALMKGDSSPEETNFSGQDVTCFSASQNGIHYYPTLDTAIVRCAPWRWTVTNYDYQYLPGGHPTGGSISLLWNALWGPLLFGGMDPYRQNEPNNMQMPRYQFNICPTTRFERTIQGRTYASSNDLTAWMQTPPSASEDCRVEASGQLRTTDQQAGGGFHFIYRAVPTAFTIDGTTQEDADFLLPVISRSEESVQWVSPHEVHILRHNAVLEVHSAEELTVPEEYRNADGTYRRLFSPVGGFQALVLCVHGREAHISINVHSA